MPPVPLAGALYILKTPALPAALLSP